MTVIRDGSSLHYSLLWVSKPERELFTKQLALIQSITRVLSGVSEGTVAERKLDWWEEEIGGLLVKPPRHPSTVAFCKSYQGILIDQQLLFDRLTVETIRKAFLAILSCHAKRWSNPPNDEEAHLQLISEDYSNRLALASFCFKREISLLDPDRQAKTTAIALGRYAQMVNIRSQLIQGNQVFSPEIYKRYALTPDDLLDGAKLTQIETPNNKDLVPTVIDYHLLEVPERIQLLLQANADATHEALDIAINDITTIELYKHKTLHPVWLLLILRQRQLQLWSSQRHNFLTEHSTLTPIRKFMIAWWQYLLLS